MSRTNPGVAHAAHAFDPFADDGCDVGMADRRVAQSSYPDKPIKLIVPQAPGSATDTVARILAAALGRSSARPS